MEKEIKLKVEIENKQPINLVDLAISLSSFANLYNDFTKDIKANLIVEKIENGCILMTLYSTCVSPMLPLISNVNNIVQFIQYLNLLIKISKNENENEINKNIIENKLPSPTIKDFKNFKNFNSINGDVKITAENNSNNTFFIGCTFNGEDKLVMNKNLDMLINNKITNNNEYKKQLFIWEQVNFDSIKQGNKGKIEAIFKEPLRVIFDNDIIKNEMTASSDDIQWQNKAYIVDIEVQTIDNIPKVYKILNNYKDESFYIDS